MPRTPNKPGLSERAIEDQIVRLLQAYQWQVIRTNRFRTGGAVIVQGALEKGMPDLQVRKAVDVLQRAALQRVVWIEVKRPGEGLTEHQAEWASMAVARGECVMTASSIEQVAEAFGIRL